MFRRLLYPITNLSLSRRIVNRLETRIQSGLQPGHRAHYGSVLKSFEAFGVFQVDAARLRPYLDGPGTIAGVPSCRWSA